MNLYLKLIYLFNFKRGQCYCGNSYGSYGKSICNTKCRGNSTQICGGDWANSVYDVSVVSKLILPVELKSSKT